MKTDVLTKKTVNIYDKYPSNPFYVSSKILLKVFKINRRHHLGMDLHSVNESCQKKARKCFQHYEVDVNMSRKSWENLHSSTVVVNKFHKYSE